MALSLALFGGGCVDQGDRWADGGGEVAPSGGTLPALPLRTQSRWIVDAAGTRFKLASVNWYGAESATFVPGGLALDDRASIAHRIRTMGFNSVRLPWCNQMVEENPIVDPTRVSANPDLIGLHALDVLDAVIEALAGEGLVVILDNHRSRGDWCCDTLHGDGLWYTADYPEEAFIADWQLMTQRYLSQPAVVGMDLRNELRSQFLPGVPATCTDCNTPTADCLCDRVTWGDMSMDTYHDWTGPAETAGNAILAINPQLLIIVEGPDYSTWLGASYLPLKLAVPNRLVYSAHNYEMSGWSGDCAAFKTARAGNWGFVVTEGAAYTAPLWLGEFGVGHDNTTDAWWLCLQSYLQEGDFDWAYWPLNGTQGPGYNRVDGQPEGYGVLDPTWMAPANPAHLQQLQALQAPTSGPGVAPGD